MFLLCYLEYGSCSLRGAIGGHLVKGVQREKYKLDVWKKEELKESFPHLYLDTPSKYLVGRGPTQPTQHI